MNLANSTPCAASQLRPRPILNTQIGRHPGHRSKTLKGISLTLLSVVLNAVCYHFLAVAMRQGTEPLAAMLLIYASAGLIWGVVVFTRKQLHPNPGADEGSGPDTEADGLVSSVWKNPAKRRQLTCIVIAAFFAALGDAANLLAIKLHGPETVAFLGNGAVVALVVFGLIRGERITPLKAAMVFLTIGGAFLFAYRGGRLAWDILVIMAGSCLFVASKQWMLRQSFRTGDMARVMATFFALACLFVCLLLFGASFWTGTFALPVARSVGWIVAAGLGSAFALFCLVRAYTLIGLARATPLDSLRPLVVGGISLALGLTTFAPPQWIGGLIILVSSMSLVAAEVAPNNTEPLRPGA